MVIAYWIVAGLLALAFVAAGVMKLARPKEQLATAGMGYVEDFSSTSIKLIGLAEVLGAAGLILPVMTGIAAWLAPFAALALAVLQVGAIVVHIRRGEARQLGVNIALVIAALAVAVLWFAVR